MELVLDRGSHRTGFKIERFASEDDAAAGRKYSAWKARRLFGTSQTSEWNGNPFKTALNGFIDICYLVVMDMIWPSYPWHGRFKRTADTFKTVMKALRYDITHYRRGNVLLNAGITVLLNLLGGISATAYNNANAYIGVGDSSTAAAAAQTGLQAATNKIYKAQQATYPQVAAQTITFQSVFGGSDANYAWAEFIVANGSGGTVALNRAVSAQGTKTSGQSWTVSLAITIN